MAVIRKRGSSWVADVCVSRIRKSKSFPTKKEAVSWANEQETSGILAKKSFRDLLEAYKEVSAEKKGSESELSRLRSLEKVKFLDVSLEYITPSMLSEYRDFRKTQVADVSVRREFIILGAMFNAAITWGWLRSSPVPAVKKPPSSKPRGRGITQNEIERILFNLREKAEGPRVAAMFLFALETGARLGELCKLEWRDVAEKRVLLRDTKNGEDRNVPLSVRAREILESRKGDDDNQVFPISRHVASQTFRRATVDGVHFHDSRSEAITRLSRKLDVLQLAKMIGHRDIKHLMIYYAESPENIADRL